MLLEVRIKDYTDLDSKEPPEFDEVEGRYRHITPGCVERAINRAKRLTAGKGTVYYEASAVMEAIADGINKTPMTHHQALIVNQVRQPNKCMFSVILMESGVVKFYNSRFLDTQPVRKSSDGTQRAIERRVDS